MGRVLTNSMQRTIRSLVIMADLDWTEDFHRQNAENLARLYRAVSFLQVMAYTNQ
ncbi:hypothetical protein BD413DRAFT_582814 [Trametes elegans]|nr:hypothetical protein BD413DRAFT_582814 [Trametes elegans]